MVASENYRVRATLIMTDGTIDISSYIKDIQIVYSLNLAIPEVAVVLNKTVTTQFKNDILGMELQIDTYKHDSEIKNTNIYRLVPSTYKTTLFSPTKKPNEYFYNLGTEDLDYLLFLIEPCYNAATINVGPILAFNTNIENLINEILPNKCTLLLNSDLNEKVIPQIYIKRQTFLSAVNYISYFFGLSKGPTCRTIVPIPEPGREEESILIISDINQNMKDAEYFDKEFIIRVPTSRKIGKQILEEYDQTQFVVDFPVDFTCELVTPIEYSIISKTYKTLYKLYKYTENEIMNIFGAVYLNYNKEKENVAGLGENGQVRIINHSCFDDEITPITSMLAYEYMFNVRGIVRFEELPNFHFIWPGELIKMTVENPDELHHSGIYCVESVLYRLTRLKGRTWQMSCEVSIVRSNMTYEGEYDILQIESQKALDISTFQFRNDVTENITNIKNYTQNLKENDLANLQSNNMSLLGVISNIDSDIQNIDNFIDYSNNNISNIDNYKNLIDSSNDINEIMNYVDQIETELNNLNSNLDGLYSYLDTITFPDSVESSYTNFDLSKQTFLSTLDYIKSETIHLGNFSNEFMAKAQTISISNISEDNLISLLPKYIQNEVTGLNSVISEVSETFEYIISQNNNYKNQVIPSYKNNIQNSKVKTEYIIQKIEELKNNGPYDSSDVDYVKSYIQNIVDTTNISNNLNIIDTTPFLNLRNKIENFYINTSNIYSDTAQNIDGFYNYLSTSGSYFTNIVKSLVNF